MEKKATSGMILTLLLISMLTLAFNIQLVRAEGTIYIRPDGTVDPPTANITSVDNVTYTFTGNIYDSIVVEKDNIVVDGAGYTVQGTGTDVGILMSSGSNITIKNVKIKTFYWGIMLHRSWNNTILGNNITNNAHGIDLSYLSSNNIISGNNITNNRQSGIWLGTPVSSNNTLSGNDIANNGYGVVLDLDSNYNSVFGNDISNNWAGIKLYYSLGNIFYHNNVVGNTVQINTSNSLNFWDNMAEGNYWSDYTGADTNGDGIGDISYIIDENNQDNYPLMRPYHGLVRNLDTGRSYSTIQEAINNASEGDRIFALSGTYYENVVVNKTVSLIGENKSTTIIDGNNTGIVVKVIRNYVNISGFTIQNSGSEGYLDSGMYLRATSYCNLTDNIVTNNYYGIRISAWSYYRSSNITLLRNNVINNFFGILLRSSNSTLRNNNLANNIYYNFYLDGYVLSEFINDVDVSNTVDGKPIYYWVNQHDKTVPSDAGTVIIVNSTNITVKDLTLAKNGAGVLMAFTQNSTIQNVTITNNWNGIRLKESHNNAVSDNNITNSYYDGIQLFDSSNNTIYHNNFINNTEQVYSDQSTNTWDNGYPSGGNYWSDYQKKYPDANELDGSGIWDTPYVIDVDNQDNYPLMEPWSEPTMMKTLVRTVKFWNLSKGTENSLTSKLEGAIHHLDMEKENGAVHKLMIFINKVEALRLRKLTSNQANHLIGEAQRIIDLIKG